MGPTRYMLHLHIFFSVYQTFFDVLNNPLLACFILYSFKNGSLSDTQTEDLISL
jgi:hypothetical protein